MLTNADILDAHSFNQHSGRKYNDLHKRRRLKCQYGCDIDDLRNSLTFDKKKRQKWARGTNVEISLSNLYDRFRIHEVVNVTNLIRSATCVEVFVCSSRPA